MGAWLCTEWNQFSFRWQRWQSRMRPNAFGNGTFRHKDHATNKTDVVWWRDEGKTQLVQRSEMEPTGIRMGVKQQTC